MNYANLISSIQDVIKQNGNEEITGPILQDVLVAMVNILGAGYQFTGIVQPDDVAPTSDYKQFKIGGAGTYTNFSAVVPDGYIGIFLYSNSWELQTIAVGSDYSEEINRIRGYVETTWTRGKLIYIEGQELNAPSGTTMEASDFIPVTPGEQLLLKVSANGSYNNVCCFYEQNEQMVGSYVQINDDEYSIGKIVTVPAGAAYLRCSNDYTKVPNPEIIYLTDVSLTSLDMRLQQVENQIGQIEQQGGPFADRANVAWERNAYIYLDGQQMSIENSNIAASDFAPVNTGDIILVVAASTGDGNRVASFYNAAKEQVGGYFEVKTGQLPFGYIVLVPQNAKYVRASNDFTIVPNPYIFYLRSGGSLTAKGLDVLGYPQIDGSGKINNLQWINNYGFVSGNYLVGDEYLNPGDTIRYTPNFIKIRKGQILYVNNLAYSPYNNVFYDDDLQYQQSFVSSPIAPVFFVAPSDGYVRLVSISNDFGFDVEPRIFNIGDFKNVDYAKRAVRQNEDTPLANTTDAFRFYPTTPRIEHKYKGCVSPQKRYLCCGFDDFRNTDFEWVIPLFEKYGFKATFNRIHNDLELAEKNIDDINNVNNVVFGNHELGDHTVYHTLYPFSCPQWNGQNPASVEGGQTPFPSNAQMRNDAGNGRNVFGFLLTSNPVNDLILSDALGITTPWGSLSDSQCQQIREFYSVMGSTQIVGNGKTLIQCLDFLSNRYLGTSGNSKGSFSGGIYTRGIFTGCQTSENHEIWERICECLHYYYKEFGVNGEFKTWSLPGAANANMWFESGGKYYYDSEHTKLVNCNAKFTSTLYFNNSGLPISRSWADVLRKFGYVITHDQMYPSRYDGTDETVMKHQLFVNGKLSRNDGVPYSTELDIQWYQGTRGYQQYKVFTEQFFAQHNTYDRPTEMYNYGVGYDDGFYKTIENLRHNSANGLICGGQWDSLNDYAEKIYWESILQYCKFAGIEVITKAEAADIAFNHFVESGNLLYNPLLVNTAKLFMPNANVPTNPDGFIGNCSVTYDGNNDPILNTSGNVTYNHFGIPVGDLKFSASVKGSGTITIYSIKNRDNLDLSGLAAIATLNISSASDFSLQDIEFTIYDAAKTAWEQVFEGLGNKVCGIQIVFSTGLQIKHLKLMKQ